MLLHFDLSVLFYVNTDSSSPPYAMPIAHKNGISIHLFPSEMKTMVSQNYQIHHHCDHSLPHPTSMYECSGSGGCVQAFKNHVAKYSQPRAYNSELCCQIWDVGPHLATPQAVQDTSFEPALGSQSCTCFQFSLGQVKIAADVHRSLK